MPKNLLAGATRFAHLLGRSAPAKPKAASADDDEDMKNAEEEEGDSENAKSEDKGPQDQGAEEAAENGKKAKKAKKKPADDDDDEDADDEGDDDSDSEEASDKGKRCIRLRERARCAAIFLDAAAASNPALAAQLAFGTDLPRTQAIAVLRTGGMTRAGGLAGRMASVVIPTVGSDAPRPGANTPASVADEIVAAYDKARAARK